MRGGAANGRCVVVGGGILGLCCALELSRAGCSVTVIERGQMGREASGAAGGILYPLYPWRAAPAMRTLALEGCRLYPGLAAALTAAGGIDPGLHVIGMLVLEAGERRQAMAWAEAHGEQLEWLPAARCQPGLSGDALWLPAVACIDNRRLLRALVRVLAHRGVMLRPDTTVQGFEIKGGQLRAVRTDQGRLACATAVVAAGAWSGALLGEFGLGEWVYPVRGQLVAWRLRAPNPLRCVLLREDRYLVPRGALVLAGSTVEAAGFDKRHTASAVAALARDAQALLPALAGLPVRARWAGLRPASADGLPLIGAVPGVGGLCVATGHYRTGVLTAPASARMIAALVTQDEPPPAAFDPARPLPATRAAL